MFFFIPGSVISLLTFPGVVIHEIAHKLFADLSGVTVYDVKYFQFQSPNGYVVHDKPKTIKTAFLISIGPLILNTILCAICTFPAMSRLYKFALIGSTPLLLGWLGISIGMHAFPSNDDMLGFVEFVNDSKSNIFIHIFAKSIYILFRIVNAMRVIWFDAIYAILIACILPSILLMS